MTDAEKQDLEKVLDILNKIMEFELAGVVRYNHHALMVFGFGRIPIVSWLRSEAGSSLLHAQEAGEMITTLGGFPSLGIGPLLEEHETDVGTILRNSLEHEGKAKTLYYELLELVEGRSVMLEEYARRMISEEEMHAADVNKMLRKPGDIERFDPTDIHGKS